MSLLSVLLLGPGVMITTEFVADEVLGWVIAGLMSFLILIVNTLFVGGFCWRQSVGQEFTKRVGNTIKYLLLYLLIMVFMIMIGGAVGGGIIIILKKVII